MSSFLVAGEIFFTKILLEIKSPCDISMTGKSEQSRALNACAISSYHNRLSLFNWFAIEIAMLWITLSVLSSKKPSKNSRNKLKSSTSLKVQGVGVGDLCCYQSSLPHHVLKSLQISSYWKQVSSVNGKIIQNNIHQARNCLLKPVVSQSYPAPTDTSRL